MRRILVLRGGALGDFIVTLPALAALRKQWPTAEIELAGNATAAALALHRSLVNAVHSQHEARWSALFSPDRLPADFGRWLTRFDLVVNFWPDPDGDLARHLPVHPAQRFITAPAMPNCAPAARHYLEALAPLGLDMASHWWPLEPLDPSLPSGTIALHPGSGSVRKNWPRDRWEELIRRLDVPLLLIVGEAEYEVWNRSRLETGPFASRLRNGSIHVAERPSLEELVAMLANARLFLGHDSGVSHLAAACGVRSLLLFGPTDPAVWAPPAPHVTVIRRGPDVAAIGIEDVAGPAMSAYASAVPS